MSSQFPSRAETREDAYGAARRGEGGKEGALEGFHEEDNPALMDIIQRTQQASQAARNGDRGMTEDDLRGSAVEKRLFCRVNQRGAVDLAFGDVETQHLDEVVDDDLEALRSMRLRQIKERQTRIEEWKRLGHGKYSELHSDREFFEEVARHERCIVALFDANAHFDSSLVHAALERIAPLHLETKFCCVSAEKASMLSTHVAIERLPVLFLVRGGKVVDNIPVDRTFTAEVRAHAAPAAPRGPPTLPSPRARSGLRRAEREHSPPSSAASRARPRVDMLRADAMRVPRLTRRGSPTSSPTRGSSTRTRPSSTARACSRAPVSARASSQTRGAWARARPRQATTTMMATNTRPSHLSSSLGTRQATRLR